VHEPTVGGDVAPDVGEGAAVAGQHEPRVEAVDLVERGEVLGHRVGRGAGVEVERDAPEQVVAGDQQAPLGLVEADVARRVAGRLDDVPVAEVGRDRVALDQLAVDLERAGLAAALAAAALDPALDGVRRDAALVGDDDAPLERLLGVVVGVVRVVAVHPDLAARARGDRRRLAAVVDVRVGAHDQPHVLELEVRLVERPLEVGERAGLVHPRVEQHDARAGSQRPGVAVRDAGPRERQPQAPDARDDLLATADLAAASGFAHGAGR
jgi:hypothetical protein